MITRTIIIKKKYDKLISNNEVLTSKLINYVFSY